MTRGRRLLYAVSGAMLLLRIGWVFCFREIDSDAYRHFFIAIAARRDPTNLAVHWVWLPLFHYVVGALSAFGFSFRALRLVNALLAGLGPLLLYDAARRRIGEEEAGAIAIAFAVAPLTTILGQSAQPETLFSILVVASGFEAARDRPVRAAIWLGLACFVRYEAWGAALALAVEWLVAALRRRRRPPLALAAIPAGLVALYVAFRWWADGSFLLFFRGTRDITSVQVARHAWTLREIVSFPIVLPAIVFGPVLLFAPIGLRRALPAARDWVVPSGLTLFLLLSYYAGASHSGERYLVSLVPFGCAAIGTGVAIAGRKIAQPRAVHALAFALLVTTTGWHLHRAAKMAIAWDVGLREREAELARLAR